MGGWTRIGPSELEARGLACLETVRRLEAQRDGYPESSVQHASIQWLIGKLKAEANKQYAEAGKRRFKGDR